MLWIDHINLFIATLLFALFAGRLCDMALRRYLKREELPLTAHITMAVAAVFLCLHGFSMKALRSILLCQVLIMAGACDAATYEIPDFLHLFIVMAGLMGLQTLPALLGFVLVPLPLQPMGPSGIGGPTRWTPGTLPVVPVQYRVTPKLSRWPK